MPERSGLQDYWVWLTVGVAILLAMGLLSYLLIQSEQRLQEGQTKFGRTQEQVVQTRAAAAELERLVANLKTELDAAKSASTSLQNDLDEANSEVDESPRSDLSAGATAG